MGKLWSCQGQKSQLGSLMSQLDVFFTQLQIWDIYIVFAFALSHTLNIVFILMIILHDCHVMVLFNLYLANNLGSPFLADCSKMYTNSGNKCYCQSLPFCTYVGGTTIINNNNLIHEWEFIRLTKNKLYKSILHGLTLIVNKLCHSLEDASG